MSLKGLEHYPQDKIDIKRKLQDVSPLLHQSLRLNNPIFTEKQRKRKSEIYESLGKNFKPNTKSDSSKAIIYLMKRL